MQDPTITAFQLIQTMKPLSHHNFPTEQEQQQQQQQQQLKCPRCESTNTKFCYYNNYNLSQPRHFCKNCRRYWTKGGALRNIPVGGGSRKTSKRSSSSSSSSSSSTKRHVQQPPPASSSSSPLVSSSASHTVTVNVSGSGTTRVDQDRGVMNIGGSFSSFLGSSGHFGTLLEGLNSNGSGMKMVQVGGFGGNFGSDPGLNSGSGLNLGLDMQSNGNSEGFLAMQNGDGGHGWSDLAIYTRGSSFQ